MSVALASLSFFCLDCDVFIYSGFSSTHTKATPKDIMVDSQHCWWKHSWDETWMIFFLSSCVEECCILFDSLCCFSVSVSVSASLIHLSFCCLNQQIPNWSLTVTTHTSVGFHFPNIWLVSIWFDLCCISLKPCGCCVCTPWINGCASSRLGHSRFKPSLQP